VVFLCLTELVTVQNNINYGFVRGLISTVVASLRGLSRGRKFSLGSRRPRQNTFSPPPSGMPAHAYASAGRYRVIDERPVCRSVFSIRTRVRKFYEEHVKFFFPRHCSYGDIIIFASYSTSSDNIYFLSPPPFFLHGCLRINAAR